MRIILLGAPGSGKGTQCKRIVARFGMLHLSSGDILRQQRSDGTELGKKAQSYMDSGGLVPDEIIVEMMADAISKSVASGFVLDGFPRTLNQASELDKSLTLANQKIDGVINLFVDEQIVTERITGRRSCPQCGSVYHIENLKPKVEDKCDNDGTLLVQRADDSVEVVANRLKNYHEQTEAVVSYYKNSPDCPGVCEIDANKDVEQVTALIFERLDSLAMAES